MRTTSPPPSPHRSYPHHSRGSTSAAVLSLAVFRPCYRDGEVRAFVLGRAPGELTRDALQAGGSMTPR